MFTAKILHDEMRRTERFNEMANAGEYLEAALINTQDEMLSLESTCAMRFYVENENNALRIAPVRISIGALFQFMLPMY